MPVRSLNSSVMKWPSKKEVEKSLNEWSKRLNKERDDLTKIGYFGSYAKENWGVGSDLDLIIILEKSEKPFERRGIDFDTSPIPVPTELLVYTRKEWRNMQVEKNEFYCSVFEEIIWINPK